ncbi:exo-alpha-sialidase [Olivibacter ginsenosidimutans]|uniref:Exo-alpha-sialidase n=2 Tax=Olivibacter ginsenosidimutans TaxID=1176537 RepID=A0ABP9AGZ3_9SPHI
MAGLVYLPIYAQTPRKEHTNESMPQLAQAGQGAYLKGELIYPLDHKPTPQCHASTIIETPSGMVAAFFAGTKEGDPDVGIRIAHLSNGKWSWPVEVANGYINDSLRYPCWNPVLFQPKEGPLMLFYKVGPSPQKWWGMVMTSTDDGRSWSVPRKLGDNPKIGHLLGPIKNKPIQLSDGTIMNPTSMESPGTANGIKWQVYFEMSKDLGKTWQVVGPIHDGEKFDAIQPSILTYPDGRLQVVCRTAQDVLVQSWSTDSGKTWRELTALPLPNPNSGTDAVTLQDGRQLLVYNHTTKKGVEPKGRNMLNVAVSSNGEEWKPVLTLENEPIADGYAYPAVIQAKDGLVHITYTFNRRSIKHVILDPNKLN